MKISGIFRNICQRSIVVCYLLLTIAGTVILLGGCTPSENKIIEAKNVLFVYPEAYDVKFTTTPAGFTQMSYLINAVYPAVEIIDDINLKLKNGGWIPQREDFMNPGTPTSHVRGWTSFIDASRKPKKAVFSWSAQWKNKNGDLIHYDLRYHQGENDDKELEKTIRSVPKNMKLGVFGVIYPKDVLKDYLKSLKEFRERAYTELAPK